MTIWCVGIVDDPVTDGLSRGRAHRISCRSLVLCCEQMMAENATNSSASRASVSTSGDVVL